MKKSEIQVGGTYLARVSGNLVSVRVDAKREIFRLGKSWDIWDVTNLKTGRNLVFRSAQKFRQRMTTPCSNPLIA